MSDHIEKLLHMRGSVHGDWALQSETAEKMWILLTGLRPGDLTASQRQALHMICTKLSRIACGNPNEPDHWLDIAGYATLAAKEIRRGREKQNPYADAVVDEEGFVTVAGGAPGPGY